MTHSEVLTLSNWSTTGICEWERERSTACNEEYYTFPWESSGL